MRSVNPGQPINTWVERSELRIREMFSRIRIRPKIFFTDPDPGAEKIPDPPGSGSATLGKTYKIE